MIREESDIVYTRASWV